MQSQERDLTRQINSGNLSADDIDEQVELKVAPPRRHVARTIRRITLDLDSVQRHNDRMKKFKAPKGR